MIEEKEGNGRSGVYSVSLDQVKENGDNQEGNELADTR
jgi:hypothetical protein